MLRKLIFASGLALVFGLPALSPESLRSAPATMLPQGALGADPTDQLPPQARIGDYVSEDVMIRMRDGCSP